MDDLIQWLRNQYGKGRRFGSARKFSEQASKGKNPNLVSGIENGGPVTLTTIERLHNVTGEPLIRLLLMAGKISPEELEPSPHTDEEEDLIRAHQTAPKLARQVALAVLRGEYSTQGGQDEHQAPELRVAEGDESYRTDQSG